MRRLSHCRWTVVCVLPHVVFALLLAGCGEGGTSSDTAANPTSATESEGCGLAAEGVASSLEVAGQLRTFELDVPAGYRPNRAYPLIFAWHGLGGSGQLARSYFGLKAQVGRDAIVVYPDGLPDQDGRSNWDLDAGGVDVQFFDAMRAHLLASLCVDEAHVFVTGHSKGGYMSNLLGCERPGSLSAIAPVAGGPTWEAWDSVDWVGCETSVGVWVAHGAEDTTVDPSEGAEMRDLWATINECNDSYVEAQPSPCVAYEGCARDTHWCLHPDGHDWPEFAGEAIWSFFETQRDGR